MNHPLYPATAAMLTASLILSQVGTAQAQVAPAKGFQAPVVFQAAGPDSASILGAVDGYRLALGEVNNGNTPGPLSSGRREIPTCGKPSRPRSQSLDALRSKSTFRRARSRLASSKTSSGHRHIAPGRKASPSSLVSFWSHACAISPRIGPEGLSATT